MTQPTRASAGFAAVRGLIGVLSAGLLLGMMAFMPLAGVLDARGKVPPLVPLLAIPGVVMAIGGLAFARWTKSSAVVVLIWCATLPTLVIDFCMYAHDATKTVVGWFLVVAAAVVALYLVMRWVRRHCHYIPP